MALPIKQKSWIVFLTTFPPRECGIATFSQDLSSAFDQLYAPAVESRIVAMNIDEVRPFPYPKKVIYQINQAKTEEYVNVAKKLNSMPQVKVVNIQHEFGIFGGQWGEHVVDFLQALKKPSVVTMHSVLPNPDKILKGVVKRIELNSERIVVFTKLSKEILVKDYKLDEKKIGIIPHGIHPMDFSESKQAKASLNLSKKTILTSFGLLSDGKGMEYVIESLPEVVKKFPNIFYLIIGATHPLVLQREGEKYRNFLIDKVYKLGLTGHVRFYNKYLKLEELLKFLRATDIYMSSSLNPNQAVSGTMSYALGTGRAVISTAFAQAKEDITSEVGILVDFKKPKEFTNALIRLLSNDPLRKKMELNAYFHTRNMTWPNVALSYMKIFVQLVQDLKLEEKHLPKIKLEQMIKLTDNFGAIQFSKLAEPDPSSGYTLDDNARALIFCSLYYEKFKTPRLLKLINIYLKFIQYVSKPDGYFDNYVNIDKTLHVERNTTESMQDANSRALYSLAVAATARSLPKNIRDKAKKIFLKSLKHNVNFTHLRSSAFYILALSLWLAKNHDRKLEANLIRHCDMLVRSYGKSAKKDWQWFENHLTYANAVLPEALFLAYPFAGKNKKIYFSTARTSLDFLISQTFGEDIYMPIGQRGWYPKGGKRALYDQQPEDASAMVQALQVAYTATGEDRYRKFMHRAFSWFLGDNSQHKIIYDETTGGSYDGLGKKEINLNQGAESTVSYLLARIMFL